MTARLPQLVIAAILMLAHISAVGRQQPLTYTEFLTSLLNSGWHPHIVVAVDALGARERDWGDARMMKEFSYVEIERCTGVEQNFCFFNFRKGRVCKRITTAGELARDGSFPVVVRIETDRCARLLAKYT